VIDERDLTDLLHEAADAFEVPATGATRILAAVSQQPAPKQNRWLQSHRLAIACAVVLVVAGTTVAIRQVTRGSETSPKAFIGRSVGSSNGGVVAAGSGGSAQRDSGIAASGGASAGLAQPAPAPAPVRPAPQLVAPPARDSAKVVKTGSVSLEVQPKGVGPTMTRLGGMATGLGGYVADTKTAEGGDDPSGSVTLRVPVDTFEQLIGQVRGLGTVKSSTTHGQDVTAQYADIQARLTALSATRDQLLTVLRKASAIGDILAVQDRLNDVQTQIDQLQGQQKVLDDQTSMASLSVDVAPKGTTPKTPSTPTGIGKAWNDARHGFTSGVEDILAASGTILVVLLVLAALAALARLGWQAARRRTL
jgi:hypothetical protein